jgi:hypothetical protein
LENALFVGQITSGWVNTTKINRLDEEAGVDVAGVASSILATPTIFSESLDSLLRFARQPLVELAGGGSGIIRAPARIDQWLLPGEPRIEIADGGMRGDQDVAAKPRDLPQAGPKTSNMIGVV